MGNRSSHKHIIVVGGGIAGLSAAWEIQQRTGGAIHITVLEADNRWGGKLPTQTMPAPDGGQFIIHAGMVWVSSL
ncbi:MAG: FAD-dependent oxidoreductase, partial [Caldilinea sp.]